MTADEIESIDYVLTRDIIENNRLNLQHYLWTELFGYHVHPAVDLEAPSNLRIADVGTGTGIWLTDLARRLPSTTALDGLDISFEAAPPGNYLPPNVVLHHYDIHHPDPPNGLRGVYDMVHVRNFSFVLEDDEIERAIRNLMQLLKPGGYLQWGDPDVSSLRIEQALPNPEETNTNQPVSSALREFIDLGTGLDSRLQPTWVPALPQLFETCGLTDIQTDVKDAPPYMALATHECNLVLHGLIARKTRNTAVGERLKALMPAAIRETRAGAFWGFTRWTVIGRKAL